MEASLTLPRCVSRAYSRPVCSGIPSKHTFLSRSVRQMTRTSSRSFTSTSHTQQDTPPQPVPLSNVRGVEDETGALPPDARKNPQLNQRERIDLSSLPGIPSSYIPPDRTQPRAGTASARLDALFGKTPSSRSPSDNPFQRAIRQTDSLNRASSSPDQPIDFSSFLDKLESSESRPAKSGMDSGKLPLRLRPTLGRTQVVDPGRNIDLTRAFLSLDFKCRQNSVKQDTIKQKFHVRRGQQRKLDRMRRWRVAFKAGFSEECARIRRMKNQGW